jgi:hypothetical protein
MKAVRLFALTALLLTTNMVASAATDIAAIARDKRTAIEGVLDAATRDMLRQALVGSPSAAGAEGFGHALLMRRHLAPAAWMFASAVEKETDRTGAVTALGVALAAGATTDGKAPVSEADLAAAVELQREAVKQLPTEGVPHHNLGTALLRLAKARGGDGTLLDEAAKSLREAVRLKGRSAPPHFYVRLAEALAALGDHKGAEQALRRAFALDSIDPVLLMARQNTLKDVPVQGDERICKVDFKCRRICPSGMTGTLMFVSCEIANADALNACMGGKPYPKAYDCEYKLPRFGILIPGLDPGFSILTPWGSIDMIQQGDGRVDWRVKVLSPQGSLTETAGLQAFLGTQGSYDPETGAMNWEVTGGAQLSVLNNNFVMNQLNAFDVAPSGAMTIKPSEKMSDRSQATIEVGRGVLTSF